MLYLAPDLANTRSVLFTTLYYFSLPLIIWVTFLVQNLSCRHQHMLYSSVFIINLELLLLRYDWDA